VAFPTYLRAITTPTVRPWVPEPVPDCVDYATKPQWRLDVVTTHKDGKMNEGLLHLEFRGEHWATQAMVGGETHGLVIQSPQLRMTILVRMQDGVCRSDPSTRPSGELFCYRIITPQAAFRALCAAKGIAFVETQYGLCVLRGVRFCSMNMSVAAEDLAIAEVCTIDFDAVFPTWDDGLACSFTKESYIYPH
jgi:hypothetical protein